MKLRAYEREDSPIIAKWIRTEEELYKWSADRINIFPLGDYDLDDHYADRDSRFIPLSAVDDDGKVVGHFFIRGFEDDDKRARFGFVIVDPDIRGKGYGREMLRLGIEYVKENLPATRIDLGVFENNPAAKKCYESLGFTEYQRRDCEMEIGNWVCIDLEIKNF